MTASVQGNKSKQQAKASFLMQGDKDRERVSLLAFDSPDGSHVSRDTENGYFSEIVLCFVYSMFDSVMVCFHFGHEDN